MAAGGESLPSIDNLAVLAAVLNVKMDDIIVYKPPEAPPEPPPEES